MKVIFRTAQYELSALTLPKGRGKGLVKWELRKCVVCLEDKDCMSCVLNMIASVENDWLINNAKGQWTVSTPKGSFTASVGGTSNPTPFNMGSFDKFIYPMIRATYPNISGDSLVDPYIYLCSDICVSLFAMRAML